MKAMKFEIGKYYKHPSGHYIHILTQIETTMYGTCLCAEVAGIGRNASNALMPVWNDETCAQFYDESTEEEWMKTCYTF
jgi:cytidine deaminase